MFSSSLSTYAQIQKLSLKSNIFLKDDASVLAYANKLLPENSGKLAVSAIRQSPSATYYTFIQLFDDVPVYGLQVKLCVGKDKICRLVNGKYFLADQVNTAYNRKKNISPEIASAYKFKTDLEGEAILFINDIGELEYGYLFTSAKDENNFESIIVDNNNTVVYFSDHRSFFHLPDSTVTGTVFLPDPLTSANTSYGGDYSDFDDSTTLALQLQQFEGSFTALFESGTFYLKNNFIEIKDFASPIIPVVTSSTNTFYYSRTDDGFEDVNTFYHLTKFVEYNTALGFPDISEFYLQVDPHGAGGADQSFYVAGSPPSIQYGEGGVDDAEDADVIVHEYTHALSDNASPGSNSGFERRAVDEGYGDYFAVSYSRSFSDYNWQNVFSWDGHNEFWSGRDANTTKHYPEDVGASIYDASEIWSGALMDIYDEIGKENTDKLVLECLYGSIVDMSMPEAALVLLNSEALHFDSLYHDIIFDILYVRGLLTGVDIEKAVNSHGIQILNTFNFTFSGESLHIKLPGFSECNVLITDLNGKKVFDQYYCGQEFFLKLDDLKDGIYFLSVKTPAGILFEKIMKY